MRARERGKVPLDERGTNTTRSLYKRTHKLTRPPLRHGIYRRQLSTERDALFGPSTLSGLVSPRGPPGLFFYHYHPPPPTLLPLSPSPSPSPPLPSSSRSSLHSLDTRRVSLMCHHYQRIGNHHHRHHLLPTGRLYLSSRLPRTRQRKRESEREGE